MFINQKPRGVTLMEIAIAATVFSMVIGISFMVTMKSTNAFHQQIQEANLTDKGEKVLKTLEEDLSDASLIASTTGPGVTGVFDILYNSSTNGWLSFKAAEIHYKVPLRYRNPTTNPMGYTVFMNPTVVQTTTNGVVLYSPTFPSSGPNDTGADFDFRLRYGWRDNARYVGNADDGDRLVPLQGPGLKLGTVGNAVPSGVVAATAAFSVDGINYPSGTLKGGYMCIRFQPDDTMLVGKYGTNGKFSEYLENIDIDGDGYKNNSYYIGHLERCYFVGDPGSEVLVPDSRQIIGDQTVLQPIYPWSGPADQLPSNRIFERDSKNPARLNVFLWLLTMAADGSPHIIQSKVAIFMRNNATYVTASSATGTN